jgi:hypothetical protein
LRAQLALAVGEVFVGQERGRQRGGQLVEPPLDLFTAGAKPLRNILAQLGDCPLDGGADLAIQLQNFFRKGHPLLSAAVLDSIQEEPDYSVARPAVSS